MRTWIIPLAVLMVVPALGAATPIVAPPVPEQLVEGHTVFTVIEQVQSTTINHVEYAAAVAVLVREATAVAQSDRFPGVLWFNDQYLVDPIKSYNAQTDIRYPCTGAVLAVNSGSADPRLATWAAGGMQAGYIESYLITDPNDRVWDVDKGTQAQAIDTGLIDEAGQVSLADALAMGTSARNVILLGDPLQLAQVSQGTHPPGAGVSVLEHLLADDATIPRTCTGATSPQVPDPADPSKQVPGCNTYMNGRTDIKHGPRYNALLYFFLEDLTVAGADKDHNVGSADYAQDGSGCDQNTATDAVPDGTGSGQWEHWPCPHNDDNQEGNSHPYNPFILSPVCPHCTGSGNHGGSGASGAQNTHATRNIDLYYGVGDVPLARNFRVTDTEGSLAPYHCNAGQAFDANNPDTDTICQ